MHCDIILILLLVSFALSAAIPHPVLLIPGLGGSQMQARIHRQQSSHWYCQQSSDWYRIWMSMTSLMPYAVSCFADNFRLVYNRETGLTENVHGVETRVENFGNVTTMEYFFDVNMDFGS
jgi:lysophospholipase-3